MLCDTVCALLMVFWIKWGEGQVESLWWEAIVPGSGGGTNIRDLVVWWVVWGRGRALPRDPIFSLGYR